MSRGSRPGGRASGSRIHQGLVGERVLIGTPYLADPALRKEYAQEIAPRTGVALGKILGEAFPAPVERHARLRVLDLGAGTGAAGAATRDYFGNHVDLVSVDRVPGAGAVLSADVTDVAVLSRIASEGGHFDLAIAAHVINELYVDEAPSTRHPRLAALVRRWCDVLLRDGGTLVLLEPALRETSRALLAVRDQVLRAGLHIVSPCFFTGDCPALLRERDWCHDAAAFLPAHGALAARSGRAAPGDQRETNNRRPPDRIDFSYLVVRAGGGPTTDPGLFRIVSDALPEKGRLKLFACGSLGRHPVVRLDRHATGANADFDQLVRGDVAQIFRTKSAQDGLRVVEDSTVKRLQK